MCTVTYVPTENGFFLTQNRDVEPDRFATEIVDKIVSDHRVIYPKDPVAGGTWMTMSDRDLVLCVMNGAFVTHAMGGQYRRSRGLVALDMHTFSSAEAFFTGIDLKHIEPFTMVAYENGSLFEFRWDGSNKFLQQMDITEPHIWASSTLYTAHWQRRRQFWFNQWLTEQGQITRENVLDFHLHAGDGNPLQDLVMNRSDLVCTVSVCSVERTKQAYDMHFMSLMSEVRGQALLPITKRAAV